MESNVSSKMTQKIKRSRFKYVPRPTRAGRLKIDPKCQEATPELLRIEIDQIFKEFVDNPELLEYIFPPNLNNLQRKYIHAKAAEMNIVSKSYGKEPNRRLHIRKKSKQLSSQSFYVTPCDLSLNYLHEFYKTSVPNVFYKPPPYRLHSKDKTIGKLVHGPPRVPAQSNLSKEILSIRSNLPIFDKQDLIIEAIRENQIVIITSETGSGKTTQVPQFIMDYMKLLDKPCKIICTQPRRISTVAAAERVAFERGDTLGSSVGYHIKLEQTYGPSTNLIYCTTGVFLRNLMSAHCGLNNITHIVIDEVHERDKLSDFLLICLKQALGSYPKLKIILMSATVNSNKFLDYFGAGQILSIPGKIFAIDTLFLEEILFLTKYMSPKMRKAQLKYQAEQEAVPYQSTASSSAENEITFMDEALDEYLNFSENYDYKIHYEEATAQLGMYFLSEGVSVDYQHSKNGRTALMIAASLGDKEFISRLCNMGANVDICCNMGKTAFEYADGNADILRLLEYIKSKRVKDYHNNDENKEAERLLQLFDKTTSDDNIEYDLVVTLISFIHRSNQRGAILVFLPGYDDIMMCNDKIMESPLDPNTYKIFLLHGSMNIRDQHDVFKHLPDKRKIILSTNIAETSITIDDVVFVIDCGKAKEKCYDSYNKVSSLQTHWISQACAKQRTGRAGRTQPGMCFRLYSKQRYDNMEEERIPEILRVSLEELCLHTKVVAPDSMNINNFLTMAPDPPSANSIKVAIENLQFLGALDKEEDMTKLGEYLAQLTVEPNLGKMLIFGVIFRCLEPILTLVASMTHKDPFQLPPQSNLKNYAAEKRKELLEGIMSDHLLYLQVFKKWQNECCNGRIAEFCRNFFISHPTMNSILETRGQLLGQLRAAGLIGQTHSVEEYNKNANCWPLVKAVICTGVYPNLAYPLNNYLATRSEKKVNVQNSSSCSNRAVTTWLFYDEMIKQRNALLIRGVSAVTTVTVSLICGIDSINPDSNTIHIDDWIEFEFPDASVIYLRAALERLINQVLSNPSYSYTEHDYLTLKTFTNVLHSEEIQAGLLLPNGIGEKPKFFYPQSEIVKRKGKGKFNMNTPNQNSQGPKWSSKTCKKKYGKSLHASVKPSTTVHGEVLCESVQNMNLPTSALADRLTALCNIHEQNEMTLLSNSVGTATPSLFGSISAPEKFGDRGDDRIFMVIKPKQRRNVEIAQQTSRWIFAPQTEKKILHYSEQRKTVFLLFTVPYTQAFQGIAKYRNLFQEYSKPTAIIEWIYKMDLQYTKLRHLRNPYNNYKPVYEGLDGQIIAESVAEELIRIYQGATEAYEKAVNTAIQGCSSSNEF